MINCDNNIIISHNDKYNNVQKVKNQHKKQHSQKSLDYIENWSFKKENNNIHIKLENSICI